MSYHNEDHRIQTKRVLTYTTRTPEYKFDRFLDIRKLIYKTGDVKYSMFNTDHDGWLKCDGRELNKVDFPELYSVLGINFDVEGDSTKFTLPDARARVQGFEGTPGSLSNRLRGELTGAETHILTTNEMPIHNHGITDPSHNHGITDPGHSHSLPLSSEGFADVGPDDDVTQGGAYNSGSSLTGISVNNATTGITINNTGGSLAHNNMQPTIFLGHMFVFSNVYEEVIIDEPELYVPPIIE